MSNKEDHQAYCDEILKSRSVIIEKNKEIERLQEGIKNLQEENQDINKRIKYVLGIINECRLFIEQEMPYLASDIKLKDYIQSKLNKIKRL